MKCGKYSLISIGCWAAANMTQHKANPDNTYALNGPSAQKMSSHSRAYNGLELERSFIIFFLHQMNRKNQTKTFSDEKKKHHTRIEIKNT